MFQEVFIALGATVLEGLLLMCFILLMIRQPKLIESPKVLRLISGDHRLYFLLGFVACWVVLRALVWFYPAAMMIINWSPLGLLSLMGLTRYTMQQIERKGAEYSAKAKSVMANIESLPMISSEIDEK